MHYVYDSVAQPTIVVLKFQIVSSNNQTVYTVNITNEKGQDPTNFLVNFPSALVKDGAQIPWKIAVSRVSLNPLFKTFSEGDFSLGLIHNVDHEEILTPDSWEEFFIRQAPFFFKTVLL